MATAAKPVECFKCKKEFKYEESSNQNSFDNLSAAIRKVVIINENNETIPFFDFPKDKRSLVNPSKIKFLCKTCSEH